MTAWIVHVLKDFCEYVETFNPPLKEYHLSPEYMTRTFGQMFLSLMENYRKQEGKKRVANKTPNNVFFFWELANMFPESPLVHVIRDGRDVVCSLLTMDWVDPATGKRMEYLRDARKAAEYWVDVVRRGQEARRHLIAKRNYIEVKYEDLVERPETTLKSLFAFMDEPWDPCVLEYHVQNRDLAGESSADQVSKPLYKTAVGRWRRDLEPSQKETVKEVAGNLLIELGYAENFSW